MCVVHMVVFISVYAHTFPLLFAEVDDAFLKWASENRTGGYEGQRARPRFNSNKLIVQPIEIVQNDESLMFGCEEKRFLSGVNQLEDLFNVNNTQGKDLEAIATTVESEIEKLYSLIKHHPCLVDDFQIFLTNQGRLIHLDVDRCFGGNAARNGRSLYKPCKYWIKSFGNIVIQRLRLLSQYRQQDEENRKRRPRMPRFLEID